MQFLQRLVLEEVVLSIVSCRGRRFVVVVNGKDASQGRRAVGDEVVKGKTFELEFISQKMITVSKLQQFL